MNFPIRSALVGLSIVVTLACTTSSSGTQQESTTVPQDMPPIASVNGAQFSPSGSSPTIPLPNILLTAAVTTPVVPVAKTPLTPDKALAWINQNEVSNTNAVGGLSSAIFITFDRAIVRSSVTSSTIKVFMVLADTAGTENAALGFRDVSSLYTLEFTKNGAGIDDAGVLLHPTLPLPPGSRFVYVVTDGVKDATTNLSVCCSLPFYYLKYQKPLTDLTDPYNPAAYLGASTCASLEMIRANVMSGSNVALSGYAKTMDDLVASATTAPAAKAALGAGATGISNRDQIRLIGRFITNGSVVTRLVADSASTQVPVETALWMWANNVPAANGGTFGSPARQWNNGITNFTTLGSSTIADPAVGSIGYFFSGLGSPLSLAAHDAIGLVCAGAFESGDLNIDPAILAGVTTKPNDGKLDGVTDAYWPGHYGSGTDVVPGTGILQGVRVADGKTLTGFYHVSRKVPFFLVAPRAAAPTGGYPVLIAQHGVGGQKEQMFMMVNSACAAGYAVIAIDQPLHGGNSTTGMDTFLSTVPAMGNGRPATEWGINFISLGSVLGTRTNMQQAGFNLWRLERILKQPTTDSTSLQTAMIAAGKPLASGGASKFVGISLGSIVGAYFLAGNSAQTGGSDMKGLLSVPGGRTTYILRDSSYYKDSINAGLAASGVPTGSKAYHQFFVLAQSIVDTADPAWATSSISTQTNGLPNPSRLSGRLLVQEAVGDLTIPNTYGRFFGNAVGGRGIMGTGFDIAPNFTQVRFAAASTPTVPFMLALGTSPLKASVAPATDASTGPTEGYFQFGNVSNPATHSMLLDGSTTDVTNGRGMALVQKQLTTWLATGRVIDPTDTAHWPIKLSFPDEGGTLEIFPPMNWPE